MTEQHRSRDAERSKQVILDAAEQLFAQYGYEATSLQQIGDRAHVSRGTPTYFFKSKEQLYQVMLERLLQAEHDAVAQAYAQATGEQQGTGSAFRDAISQHIDFLLTRPTFLRILTREALAGGERLAGADNYLAVLQAGRAIVAQEQARGSLRPMDARYLLLQVLGLCWLPFVYGHVLFPGLDLDPADPSVIASYKEQMLDFVLAAVARR